jgi:hypothetical protein
MLLVERPLHSRQSARRDDDQPVAGGVSERVHFNVEIFVNTRFVWS